MESNNEIYRQRTKQLAVRVIKFIELLPKNTATFVLSKQLLRSASSVAANYRAMCISRSPKERYAKMCIVLEETDETVFWLELLYEAGIAGEAQVADILKESNELVKIFTSYRSKLKLNLSTAPSTE